MESVDLDALTLHETIVAMVPLAIREKLRVVPVGLQWNGALRIAIADPMNFPALDEVRFVTGRVIEALAASEEAIARALRRTGPVWDLKPYFAVPPVDVAATANILHAIIFRAVWLEARFITLEEPGVWLWLDQHWKLEAEAAVAIRDAVIRQLRVIAEGAGVYKPAAVDTAAFGMAIMHRGSRGILVAVHHDDRGLRAAIEIVADDELEQRDAADRLAPELPESHPYR